MSDAPRHRRRAARARAHANIALAKYWGKSDVEANVPAVPSVSITLAALTTTTSVVFDDALSNDTLWIGGASQQGRPLARVQRLLDEVRAHVGLDARARVDTVNDFPTAAGLASSASAFAAVALAAVHAAGAGWDVTKVSDLARRSSASAGRSLFGGFVRLGAGAPGTTFLTAEPIAPAEHWDLRVVVAVASEGPKSVSSTQGMLHTAATSPYYDAWVALCPSLAARVEKAILDKDFGALTEASEQSALAMHASALAAAPGVVYFEPVTLAALSTVRRLRADGVPVFATMDAGPHVKAVTLPEHAAYVQRVLEDVPGVLRTIASSLGGDASVELLESAT